MSVDRMDIILGGSQKTTHFGKQWVFPETTFTCDGNIQSLIVGAEWAFSQSSGPKYFNLSSMSFIDLQIWRSNGNGNYTRVENTTITTGESTTQFYQYNITPPLLFRAGDILGCYLPPDYENHMKLYFEENGRGQQLGYYYESFTATDVLNVNDSAKTRGIQALLHAVTGELLWACL